MGCLQSRIGCDNIFNTSISSLRSVGALYHSTWYTLYNMRGILLWMNHELREIGGLLSRIIKSKSAIIAISTVSCGDVKYLRIDFSIGMLQTKPQK
jgi:hypothetical protein